MSDFAKVMTATEEAVSKLTETFKAAAGEFGKALESVSDEIEKLSAPEVAAWAAFMQSAMGEAEKEISKALGV